MTASFNISTKDRSLISKIASRAAGIYAEAGSQADRLHIEMDLTATHANGNPLRLADLLAADDFNLMHDVVGINRHIDRSTGKLTGFFTPRFSDRQSEAA